MASQVAPPSQSPAQVTNDVAGQQKLTDTSRATTMKDGAELANNQDSGDAPQTATTDTSHEIVVLPERMFLDKYDLLVAATLAGLVVNGVWTARDLLPGMCEGRLSVICTVLAISLGLILPLFPGFKYGPRKYGVDVHSYDDQLEQMVERIRTDHATIAEQNASIAELEATVEEQAATILESKVSVRNYEAADKTHTEAFEAQTLALYKRDATIADLREQLGKYTRQQLRISKEAVQHMARLSESRPLGPPAPPPHVIEQLKQREVELHQRNALIEEYKVYVNCKEDQISSAHTEIRILEKEVRTLRQRYESLGVEFCAQAKLYDQSVAGHDVLAKKIAEMAVTEHDRSAGLEKTRKQLEEIHRKLWSTSAAVVGLKAKETKWKKMNEVACKEIEGLKKYKARLEVIKTNAEEGELVIARQFNEMEREAEKKGRYIVALEAEVQGLKEKAGVGKDGRDEQIGILQSTVQVLEDKYLAVVAESKILREKAMAACGECELKDASAATLQGQIEYYKGGTLRMQQQQAYTIGCLQSQLQGTERDSAELKASLVAEIASLRRDLVARESCSLCEAKDWEIESLQTTIAVAEERYEGEAAASKKKLSECYAELRGREWDSDVDASLVTSLRSEIRGLREEAAASKKKLSECYTELRHRGKHSDVDASRLTALRSEVGGLKEEVLEVQERYEREAAASKEKLSECYAELRGREWDSDVNASLVTSLRSEIRGLKEEVRELQERLVSETETLSKEVQGREEIIKLLKQTAAASTEESEAHEEKIAELEREIKAVHCAKADMEKLHAEDVVAKEAESKKRWLLNANLQQANQIRQDKYRQQAEEEFARFQTEKAELLRELEAAEVLWGEAERKLAVAREGFEEVGIEEAHEGGSEGEMEDEAAGEEWFEPEEAPVEKRAPEELAGSETEKGEALDADMSDEEAEFEDLSEFKGDREVDEDCDFELL